MSDVNPAELSTAGGRTVPDDHAIIQHHGGEASLIVNGKRGTTIRLTFNALRD